MWIFAVRWQLRQWLSSAEEQKNPISSIYTVDGKMGRKEKKIYWKKKSRYSGEKKSTRIWKAKGERRKMRIEEGGSMKRTSCGGEGGGGVQAGWLLNMRLFYRRAGIEWKCDKYIDIVFGRLFRLFGSRGPSELQQQQQRQGAEVAEEHGDGLSLRAPLTNGHVGLKQTCHIYQTYIRFSLLWHRTLSFFLWAAGRQSREGMRMIRDNSKPVQSAAFLYLNVKLSVPPAQKVLTTVQGKYCADNAMVSRFSCYHLHLNYVDISSD